LPSLLLDRNTAHSISLAAPASLTDALRAVASSALPRRMSSSARFTVERSRADTGALGAAAGAVETRVGA
jgi:hypothetical protein